MSNKVEGTELWVCTKQEGFLSVVLGSLRDFRLTLKKEEKNAGKEQKDFLLVAHTAIKLILNAAYGVFGDSDQDLYLLPLAAATTSIGRNYLSKAVSVANKLGLKVVFGDTDSLIVVNPKQEQIDKLNEILSKEINMSLEVGKSFRYIVTTSRKKNYIGITKDGNIDIKGLTGKKRHVCQFIKSVFNNICEVLKQVNTVEQFDSAKEQIKRFIKEAVNRLYVGEYDLEELAFAYTLGKPIDKANENSQLYRAAKLLNPPPKRGEVIQIVLTRGKYSALPISMAKKEMIDLQAYVSHLSSALEQILEPLGLDFDEAIGNKPKSLFEFTE
jgi:DNA polymerase I